MDRGIRLALAILCTWGSLAFAQPRTPTIGMSEEGTFRAPCAKIDFGPAFDVTGCEVDASASVTIDGDQSIGDASDFKNCGAGGVDQGGTCVEAPHASAVTASDCNESGELSRYQFETSGPPGARMQWCNGSSGYERQGHTMWRIGGTAADGDFTWNGTTGCSQGTIASTTCKLTPNCWLGHSGATDSQTTSYDCCYEFGTFTLSGGTVTCGDAPAAYNSAPIVGQRLVLRFQIAAVSSGTIDMSGRGPIAGQGAASGGSANNRAGGAGAGPSMIGGQAAGAAGDVTGANGIQAPATPRILPFTIIPMLQVGGSGGGGASKGAAGGQGALGITSFYQSLWWLGGVGSNGGGCSTSADSNTTTAGGNGGRGGGAVWLETPNDWSPGTLVINTSGANGVDGGADSAGGGGGTGGSIVVMYGRTLDDSSATYTTTGGTGGASTLDTGCAPGGNGANGRVFKLRAPL